MNVGFIASSTAIIAIIFIIFHLFKNDSALAAGVREGRIKLESSIDVASAATSILLNVIVINRAIFFVFVSICLAHEEVGWDPLGLPSEAELEGVFLYIIYLPAEEYLVWSFSRAHEESVFLA